MREVTGGGEVREGERGRDEDAHRDVGDQVERVRTREALGETAEGGKEKVG